LCESNTDVLVDRPTSLSAWTRAPWRYRSRPALGQGWEPSAQSRASAGRTRVPLTCMRIEQPMRNLVTSVHRRAGPYSCPSFMRPRLSTVR